MLPSALPTIRERPLSSVPSLVRPETPPDYTRSTEQYDVFISHASEDKDEVARPLAAALHEHGLKVWYDEFTLRIGDSLRRKIDEGLANSRVGLVILSPTFLGKGWTNHELDGIVTRSVTGDQVLLPIWHKLSKQEVIAYSPSLADKLARNTATHTVQEIAAEIAELISAS
ncbi:MAG TPA: toll/interleukin-1 receptor domain-containing protein [Paraburkholderia sp.]|uniref:toll/interleukin-1 receptor domain-containing protein n=1 Tax=Paraburkholderia sp. TaxID=1926495 RepID=UPI002B49B3F7|nr:toll/interleukin-1 receptor domain-containing protein [Paraburkholderia sp.]HKR43681.1 toll/interleukin-1 receptor domain-containing protein [Paraburkholderia sp.]